MEAKFTEIVVNAPWYKKIAILRILKGWTQKEAAIKCGTDQRIYWNWENGKYFPRNISRRAIAKAFGVSVDEIFGGEKVG